MPAPPLAKIMKLNRVAGSKPEPVFERQKKKKRATPNCF